VRTPYGPATYALRRDGDGYVLTLGETATPPGGYVLRWPNASPPARLRIDGQTAAWTDGELRIPAGARRVEMR
jgi:hypothetical protein